jgi:DNA-binding CsgD family transcriptional regulator
MQLLERESQLQLLEDARGGVEAGEGCVALVYGEAGIGKTSLVEHFLHQQSDTWRILRGACESLFTPRPLGPLHDIAAQTGGKLRERLESATDRGAIFAASLAELGRQPTIMVVEDIHWADEATLDLLKYLGRRIQQTAALMILTYRDDELGTDHPLRWLLGDLAASTASRRVAVPALSPAAVGRLAGDRQIDAVRLHQLTNGNPFFITEVLETEGRLPETVRDAVLARAARLAQPAREVLEAAAVIGQQIEPWLLRQLAGADTSAVQQCFDAGMLQAAGSAYAFRHALARQAVLASIAMPRRIELHRQALRLLKDAAATRADLARLAYHAEGAQEAALVLEYAPAAARQASAAPAHREAAALYELALQFGDLLDPASHAQMLEACAVELTYANRFADCVPIFQQATALWDATGNRLRQGDALSILSISLYAIARTQEAEQASRSAIDVLELLPPGPELARAYRSQCYLRMENRDCAEAVRWGEKAMALAEQFGDTDTVARSCNYAGCGLMVLDLEAGRRMMKRGLAIALAGNAPFAAGGIYANLAQMLAELHCFSDAREVLGEGMPYCLDQDDHYHVQGMRIVEAAIAFRQGKWKDAAEALDRAAQSPGTDTYWHTLAITTRARLGLRVGDNDGTALAEALEFSARTGALPTLAGPRAAAAESAWLAGDNVQAAKEAGAAYELALSKKHPWIAGELAFWRWRAGDEFTAPEWIAAPFAAQIAGDWRAAAELWMQLGCPYEQGMALMDGDQAAQLEALTIFERLGTKPILEKLKLQLRSQGVRGIRRGPRPSTRTNAFGLTAREFQVLGCLVKGSSNSAIAKQLSLSPRTVEHHIASILQKTRAQSRSEAVALALREHLIVTG